MQRLKLEPNNFNQAIEEALYILRQGGLIIYPTETVYGLGANAKDQVAIDKLIQYKNRPAGKAISVMVDQFKQALKYVQTSDTAQSLAQSFLPGPVTIVCQSLGQTDPRLESERKTLGIRVSLHPFANHLAECFAGPITATSANAAGKAQPYNIDHLLANLSAKQLSLIDLIIDAGELPKRDPSTVIDTTQSTQEILRVGSNFNELTKPYLSNSETQTVQFAQNFMSSIQYLLSKGPVVIALDGDLGAGKTHFTKGIAKALQIKQTITSPSFSLMKEYQGIAKLVHLDCWRLEEINPQELGLDEYLQKNTVLVIEWPKLILDFIQPKAQGFHLFLEITGENQRLIHQKKLE
jgi:tRNA threonylcarbamoyl adenosine modification protein (Sua5/YciO/YrdC/YwlC family)/tRNA threonylcarbamoyl adenosine modification protein YjeE